MINAVIIDDEPNCIVALQHDLDMFCPQVNVLDICDSGKAGIIAIKKYDPDLIFLDIDMPLMNGFDMLEQLGHIRNFQVIFTTAYDQFVLKAIRASALDYLLKPIDGHDLADAVDRAEQNKPGKQPDLRIDNLIANTALPERHQKIALPNSNGYEFLDPAEISYCIAEGSYTTIVLADDRRILISRSLGETAHMLPADIFERIHHSVIVNLSMIKQFKKDNGFFVVMSNGNKLSVARSRKQSLLFRLGIK